MPTAGIRGRAEPDDRGAPLRQAPRDPRQDAATGRGSRPASALVTLRKVSHRPPRRPGRPATLGRMIHVALVTDGAGSFAAVLPEPLPRSIEGGRILVTTLATFDREPDARAFLRGLEGVNAEKRERSADELAALRRHGIAVAAMD